MVTRVLKCSICCTGDVGSIPGPDTCDRQSLGMSCTGDTKSISCTGGVTCDRQSLGMSCTDSLKLCWTCLSLVACNTLRIRTGSPSDPESFPSLLNRVPRVWHNLHSKCLFVKKKQARVCLLQCLFSFAFF